MSHMEQSGVRVMRHYEPAALEKVDSGRLMVTSNEKGHENSSKVSSPSLCLSTSLSLSLLPPLYYWSSLSAGRMGYCTICYRYIIWYPSNLHVHVHVGGSVCLLHVQYTMLYTLASSLAPGSPIPSTLNR